MISNQRKLFIDEYIKLRCKNAKQAAINAGYSAKSAQSQASQILMNANVKEYLKKQLSELEKELRQDFFFDALEARKVLFKVMNDDRSDNRDRITAAKDFLDRAGFKPNEKIEHSGEIKTEVSELSDEQIEKEIKKMRSELGLDANG